MLLGWNEIVRRATLDQSIADKHFGPAGGGAPRSPLLATWIMSNGKLEKTREERALSVAELAEDLHDWPTGRFVIQQRESDKILEKLRSYEGRKLSMAERKTRIALRKKLRVLTDAEDLAVRAVNLMLADPELSGWFLTNGEPNNGVPLAIEAFLKNHLRPEFGRVPHDATYLRVSPPRDPHRRCSTLLTKQEVSSILSITSKRKKRYGKPLTDTVMELPMMFGLAKRRLQ